MFRVNQCFYCFAVECICALLMILLIIICCISINTKSKEISRLLDENKILDEYKNALPFIGCQYKKPLDFSTISCSEDENSYVFISRLYESASNDYRYIDRLDVAPPIDISKHQGRILRIKDFMMPCPKCAVRSYFGWRDKGNDENKYATSSERCAREIKTFTYGWPQHARFCDGEEEHEVTDFCRIHELLRDKLSVKMDQTTDAIDYNESIDEALLREADHLY